MRAARPFSIRLYVSLVFAVSWPFQLTFVAGGDALRPILLLSMVMAGVGTFAAGRYVFRDGFAAAGWRWGRPRHYALAFGLALFLWLVPVVIENGSGLRAAATESGWIRMLASFVASFAVTLVPAFGEEFSWRGYLLPRLLERFPARRALLVHGLVTWLWHLPVIVTMGLDLGGDPVVAVASMLAVSLIPTVLHAVVFAYVWSASGSLIVATVYHAAFDEVRDTLDAGVGLGPLAEGWQAVVLTILGGLLLWRVSWASAASRRGWARPAEAAREASV